MNPRIKGRFAAEPADCAVRFGENILQKIVRVLVVRAHVVHQAVKTRVYLMTSSSKALASPDCVRFTNS